jgi:hypothetical protein
MLFVGVGCGEFHHTVWHCLLALRRFSLSFPISTTTWLYPSSPPLFSAKPRHRYDIQSDALDLYVIYKSTQGFSQPLEISSEDSHSHKSDEICSTTLLCSRSLPTLLTHAPYSRSLPTLLTHAPYPHRFYLRPQILLDILVLEVSDQDEQQRRE